MPVIVTLPSFSAAIALAWKNTVMYFAFEIQIRMKQLLLPFVLLLTFLFPFPAFSQSEPFSKRVVATGFNSAWEVLYGPNDSLWVTENKAYLVRRVNIANGMKTTLLNLRTADPSINFNEGTSDWPQGGLMGMALHPNLYSSDPAVRAAKPWVYIAYVYNKGTCSSPNGCFYTTKIVRYTYNGSSLSSPQIVLDNLPGSSDHNSGRLVISPQIEIAGGGLNDQYRLYYTIGDMGAGQFTNQNRTQNAQTLDAFEGKVLRINTEIDGDSGADAWVPDNNPFYNGTPVTARDYVYTMGHRNAQGLVWGQVNGSYQLYSTEQMDRTDDEVNLIEPGKNYGWDKVSGYCDGNVNGFRVGTTPSANEGAFCSVSANNHREPIFTTFTEPASGMAALYAQSDNSQWPTIASSSIDFYRHTKIAGWQNSLFITPLKKNFIYRIRLNATGDGITGDTISYFRGDGNRIRDMAISPDGLKFYVARDVGASSNGGAIMEYTYTGVTLSLQDPPSGPQRPEDRIRIYPNPTPGRVYIHGEAALAKPLKVDICDPGGRVLKQSQSFRNDFEIDISELRQGVYILQLSDGNGRPLQTRKLVYLR